MELIHEDVQVLSQIVGFEVKSFVGLAERFGQGQESWRELTENIEGRREALRELRLKLKKEVLLSWELEERVQIRRLDEQVHIRRRWGQMVKTRREYLEEIGLSEDIWLEEIFGEASRVDQQAPSEMAGRVESRTPLKSTDAIEEANGTKDPHSPATLGALESVTPVATVKAEAAASGTPQIGEIRRKAEIRAVQIPGFDCQRQGKTNGDVDSRNLKKMKTENHEKQKTL